MAIFQFFKIAAVAILDFKNVKLLMIGRLQMAELRRLAKFRRNRSNRGRYMAIFSIFKDGGRRHLGFLNFKFLTVGRLKRAELCRLAKFGRNRSKRGRDMAIFRFSRWRPSAILDLFACVRTTHERHLVVFIAVQNLVGISAVVLIICTFFDFASLA